MRQGGRTMNPLAYVHKEIKLFVKILPQVHPFI